MIDRPTTRRRFVAGLGLTGLGLGLPLRRAAAAEAAPAPADWAGVLASARGQTVYFHAWAGEARINAYIAWAGRELAARFGVSLVHVKITDTATVVAHVLAEKSAGKLADGSVDLVWINGANFAAMKQAGLLWSPGWATRLPHWPAVDVAGKPTVVTDFNTPTDGLEAPWGMAQLVFYRDGARLPAPPRSIAALLAWAKAHPGRFTYPQPPDFLGLTFLKQALVELAPEPAKLQAPVNEAEFDGQTAPLFGALDALHPSLWRQGRAFPANVAALRRLFADSEIDIGFSFNPGDASTAIAAGEWPASVRSFVLDGGTIGNSHFVAIPFNARAKAGALVAADFLLSPEAQARKQDPQVWGDPTVLDVARLTPEDRARFDRLDLGVAGLTPAALGRALPEPDASWTTRLGAEWARRYSGN